MQQRLLDYEIFSGVGRYLEEQQCSSLGRCIPSREHERLAPQFEGLEAPLIGDPAVLLILYEQLLATLSERTPVKVKAETEAITIEELMDRVTKYIEKLQVALFQKLYDGMESRYELVAHIMALLQLTREHKMKLVQQEHLGPLWMVAKNLDETSLHFEA